MEQKTLLKMVVNELGVDIHDKSLLPVTASVVRYLTGVDTAYTFQHKLKTLVDFNKLEDSAKTFRLKLLETAYLSLKLKYFSFCLALHPFNLASLKKFASDFDIDRNDVVLIRRVFEMRGFRRDLRKSERLERLHRCMVDVEAFDEMYDMFDRIYPALMRYIRKIAWSKLRFLTFSTNTESSDFHGELLCKAIKTFNHLMPSDFEELYIQNYIKRAIANHAQNIIAQQTTQKRGRLVQGKKDGFGSNEFQLTVVSQNQLFGAFGIEAASYENLQNENANSEEVKIRDSIINFESILRKFGVTPKRYALLELVSGVEHKDYTDYLHDKKIIEKHSDNVDYYNKVSHNTYLKRICEFLEVKHDVACRFLNHVGRKAYPELDTERRTLNVTVA